MVEQREGYYDYMVRRMREEDEKCRGSACRAKLPMSPWEATRKINELEKRIKGGEKHPGVDLPVSVLVNTFD